MFPGKDLLSAIRLLCNEYKVAFHVKFLPFSILQHRIKVNALHKPWGHWVYIVYAVTVWLSWGLFLCVALSYCFFLGCKWIRGLFCWNNFLLFPLPFIYSFLFLLILSTLISWTFRASQNKISNPFHSVAPKEVLTNRSWKPKKSLGEEWKTRVDCF